MKLLFDEGSQGTSIAKLKATNNQPSVTVGIRFQGQNGFCSSAVPLHGVYMGFHTGLANPKGSAPTNIGLQGEECGQCMMLIDRVPIVSTHLTILPLFGHWSGNPQPHDEEHLRLHRATIMNKRLNTLAVHSAGRSHVFVLGV